MYHVYSAEENAYILDGNISKAEMPSTLSNLICTLHSYIILLKTQSIYPNDLIQRSQENILKTECRLDGCLTMMLDIWEHPDSIRA
ncbi:hypothetical protein GDO78_019711 [Eleutherodactylus coqui]|uniref:Uncharacterized protein n=1 Tax=Eleutherodactylus coqui TaxID=57060 RepID=A0A8J6EMW7_ELECQ|nr:hypothetical protein GDO78_019711 [Eleutherodactylus coqui]